MWVNTPGPLAWRKARHIRLCLAPTLVPHCVCLRLAGCHDRGCSNDEDRRQIFASDGDGRSLAQIEVSEGTFLQLATQRFDARIAASGLPVEDDWAFPNLQVIYIYIYTGVKSSGAAY